MQIQLQLDLNVGHSAMIRIWRIIDLPWIPFPGSHVSTESSSFKVEDVNFVIDSASPLVEINLETHTINDEAWKLTVKSFLDDGWECSREDRELISPD